MIKFKYAIHKETQGLLTYNDWLKYLKSDYKNITFITRVSNINWETSFKKENTKRYTYKVEDVLISDDFEIIYDYDNEFSEAEYEQLYLITRFDHYDLFDKILNKLHKIINSIKNRFGVE
ncbi:hypothetical protein AB2T90_12135 [Clostridium butyricum]|uniref:hypothetical protein n=1 Tax=Clostridium butyricum TaxID=1492 RepID=UPI0034658353